MTILCTIYQDVARRMGIDVEPVSKNISSDESYEYWGPYEFEELLVLRWHEFPE
jgi:hypothetical protein